MSTGPINNLNNYLQSVLGTALQGTGLATSKTGNDLNAIDPSSLEMQSDNSRLSPFAQVLNTLQKLQQSDPAKYQEVTQQIATNLQGAAQTAQAEGNTTAASRLDQLAADFTSASKSGQLPNVQDLAQAMHGHHHHHHAHAASSDSGSDASANSSSTGAVDVNGAQSNSRSWDQMLAAFQSSATQHDSLDPMAIVLNTLSSSGVSISNT